MDEFREACESGRLGEMIKVLNELGRRGDMACASGNISVNDLKEHFERVSSERYEVEPEVIERAVNEANDLRGDGRAREANELLNEDLNDEEILEAMKEMEESAPGADGVRIGFVK